MSAGQPLKTSILHHRPDETGPYDPTARGLNTPPRVWANHFLHQADQTCLIDPSGRAMSWAELDAASRTIAGRFAGLGLRRGDRILISAQASFDLAVAHVASLRLGLVVVPTNVAYRAGEIAHVVHDARPRAAIVDDEERAGFISQTDASVILMNPEVEISDARASELDRVPSDAPALIGYTSGTTGRPKGAVLTHANLLASLEALRVAWRWSPEDRLVLALPLFHMHGLGVGLHGTLHAGGSAILLPKFEPRAIFDAIGAHQASLFFGVPTMYHRLVEDPRVSELATLRLCVSGSAALPAELHKRFEVITGQRIVERYGMTETAMLISNPVDAERRPGTVGVPLPGVKVRLHGQPSEIEVQGPNVFSGYWERPEANQQAFTEDLWFRTGDLGEVDEAGYLRIVGRAKELIISGGYNVYPREVEDALCLHPDVSEAAVVGAPSSEWGEQVEAYLVCSRKIELQETKGFLSQHLASYKSPRALYCVDELPRNALGKVQKHRLREGQVWPDNAN
ncbi:MAG: AMP-binding protein [Myxococcota bacterium]|nr:AMP-binding protein [Myxococcota bacterium]